MDAFDLGGSSKASHARAGAAARGDECLGGQNVQCHALAGRDDEDRPLRRQPHTRELRMRRDTGFSDRAWTRSCIAGVAVTLAACARAPSSVATAQSIMRFEQESGTNALLIAVSPVDERTVWV